MSQLTAKTRAQLTNAAFAYVDSKGRRRLPIHDEAHVRNALARFNQTRFEDDAARERARKRLLTAAKKHGIVPIGFITGQLATEAAEQCAAGVVLGQPFRRADPAVAIGGAAVLQMERVQHAVADEPVRAGRVELGVGTVTIERAVELARQVAGHFQKWCVAFEGNWCAVGPR